MASAANKFGARRHVLSPLPYGSSFPTSMWCLVVVGKNETALSPVVYANGASLVVNPDPARGQFSSLRVGLQEVLNRGRDAAMITLVDRPPVRAETLATLEAAYEQAAIHRKWAVIPEYQGKHGHPILAGREMLEAFLRAPETSNARDVEHAHQSEIEYVPVDDPLVAVNVDTPEQYAALNFPSHSFCHRFEFPTSALNFMTRSHVRLKPNSSKVYSPSNRA